MPSHSNKSCPLHHLQHENKYKLKEKDKAAFYSLAEEWVLPAASTKELEEREIVEDSGASMHIVSKRDLNSGELETMRTSRSPTTVMTANGEVQTREEATDNVQELDLFVTVMLLEETPAVLSLGKLCDDHGCTYHCTSGQKTHLTKKGKRNECNLSNFVPFVVRLSTSSCTTPTLISSSSSSQDSVFDANRYTESPVPERSGSTSEEVRETCSINKKTKIKVKEEKKYKAIYRISERIWSMKVVLQRHGETLRLRIESLQALLMNYQWRREQKRNGVRVSIVSTRIVRRTQLAILA